LSRTGRGRRSGPGDPAGVRSRAVRSDRRRQLGNTGGRRAYPDGGAARGAEPAAGRIPAGSVGESAREGGGEDMMAMNPKLLERGMANRSEVLGRAHVERARSRATPFTQDFQDYLTQY